MAKPMSKKPTVKPADKTEKKFPDSKYPPVKGKAAPFKAKGKR